MVVNLAVISPLHISYRRGFERWTIEVSKRLVNLGYRIIVVYPTQRKWLKNFDELSFMNIHKLRRIEFVELESTYVCMNPLKLLRIINANDIAYFNMAFAGFDVLASILKIANKEKTKFVYGYHGLAEKLSKLKRLYWEFSFNTLLRLAHLHHVLNEERRCFLLKNGIKNVIKIPNGVDTTKFSLDIEAKIGNEKFKVLYVGALTRQKGVMDLIKMIVFLNTFGRGKNMEFLIVGDGPLRHHIQYLENKYNNVKYLGAIYDDIMLSKLYMISNIFVSLSKYEEFSLAPLEALAAGNPVVVYDSPGPREYALNKCVVNLVRGLDEAIMKVLHYYELWRNRIEVYIEICEDARRIAKIYDWNRIAVLLHKAFQKILNS